MRTYLFLFISLFLLSCQIDIDDDNTRFEKIPAFDIQIPPTMNMGFEYTISFKYALPNGCYSFYGIDTEYNDLANTNVRVITAFASVSNSTCTQVYTEETYSFEFTPNEAKTYLFKFWAGQDDQGIDLYEEIELNIE